jgi:hypothetical protein
MTTVQLQELARVGAESRLRAIEQERQVLLRVFPDLGNGATPAKRASFTTPSPSTPAARKRNGMSPAQRRAVGERMKAYWAKRRGEKAGTEDAETQSASDTTQTPAKPTSKPKTMSPGRKAQAEKMRAYWAARRAEKQAGEAAPAASGKAGRKTGRKKARKK